MSSRLQVTVIRTPWAKPHGKLRQLDNMRKIAKKRNVDERKQKREKHISERRGV